MNTPDPHLYNLTTEIAQGLVGGTGNSATGGDVTERAAKISAAIDKLIEDRIDKFDKEIARQLRNSI